jgi:hypothetical protein
VSRYSDHGRLQEVKVMVENSARSTERIICSKSSFEHTRNGKGMRDTVTDF